MTIPWYEWRPIRNKLLAFGRAIQGASPYRVVLETDPLKCPAGITNFSKRLIIVNPTMFPVPPEEQYDLTKAAITHEGGHRRFTVPTRLPRHVHLVSNILEDERIERLMEEEYAGTRRLLRLLSYQLLDETPPLDPADDSPLQVLNYILQLRWSERAEQPVKGSLSLVNERRWEIVEPLVNEAWSAQSSLVCDRNAEEICRILGIGEPDIPEWLKELVEMLEVFEGERKSGDSAEQMAPTGKPAEAETEGEPKAFDGEPLPNPHGVGVERHEIQPAPYIELVESVRPLVEKLVEALEVEKHAAVPEPSERGGRLSVRQYLSESSKPFTLLQNDGLRPPTLTFRVLIDHSTSMNHAHRMDYAVQAAMLLHLAALELEIPHQIVVCPDSIRVADLHSGERGLALIAGMSPAQTGHEDMGKSVSIHGSQLARMSEDIRVLLVIHDGMGNDHNLLAKECKRLRGQVFILGLGIGMGDLEAELMGEQFGEDRYMHCAAPEELPGKVGAVMRAIRGV